MIWVISDRPADTWGILTLARCLEQQNHPITVYVTGDLTTAETAFTYGARRVRLLAMPAGTIWEQYITVLGEQALHENPGLILVNASHRGQTIAAMLAAWLDCPCLSQCQSITVGEDGKIYAERFSLGGRCLERITTYNRTLVITVPARISSAVKLEQWNQGEVTVLPAPAAEKIVVKERKAAELPELDLEQAPVVVGVGRGLGSREALGLAAELAAGLGGALACSRSVAEDLHWLPANCYLGITGRSVKPRLYLALGISGQPQHIYGIREAGLIVAVNTNANAPIAGSADYFFQADLLQLLPALLKELQKNKELLVNVLERAGKEKVDKDTPLS